MMALLITTHATTYMERHPLAPPKSELLTGALADALTQRAKTPFTLTLTQLTSSPPKRFTSAAAQSCGTPIGVSSISGDVLTLDAAQDETLLALLFVLLCEPYPITTINELKGHLDPDDRAILADASGFSYRLGDASRSHIVVDFELTHIRRIQFKASKKASSYLLVVSRGTAGKEDDLVVSMSKDGRLQWTARVEPS